MTARLCRKEPGYVYLAHAPHDRVIEPGRERLDPRMPQKPETSKKREAHLLRNALASYGGHIVYLVTGFLLTPYILSHLGNALFGVWALTIALQSLGGLLDFGVTTGVAKYVAEHRARGDLEGMSRVVSSSVFLHALLGILTFGVFALAITLLLPLLKLSAGELGTARDALLVAGATFLFALPLGALAGLLTGLNEYGKSNAINIVQTLSAAAATLWVLDAGGGPVELVAVNSAALVAAAGLKAIVACRMLPGLRISFRQASLTTVRRIGGYSSSILALDTLRKLYYNADALLVAAVLPVSQVTLYSIGFRPASALSYIPTPFVSVFLPAASEMEASQEKTRLHSLLIAGTRISLALTLPFGLWLLFFGAPLLQVWVGPGYDGALPVLYTLVALFLAWSVQEPSAVILRGIGQMRRLSLLVLFELAIKVALALILATQLGVVGVALGALIPAIFNDLALIPRLACRAISLGYREFLLGALIPPLAAAIPTLMILWLLNSLIARPTLPALAMGLLAALLIFGTIYILFAAGPQERRLLTRLTKRLTTPVPAAGATGEALPKTPEATEKPLPQGRLDG